ncbi:MASE1 domain-containing protein [Luteibacter anthropi]|uniref:MASE1 domain-containing protein n=1 Tax=Luteibacter anthropi TaxID=564369 RepID=A0A7X5UAG7_9GAMM|nr:MASE1 domain-containing protein [Luteibacter anthropi]NII06883.1 hypothetical protein [Luteibacter anthropi]URX61447.1 MASE1 domain-containing protein [Luteibacter anthropi]
MAIAAAYGAAYEIARHLSFPQWMITAGLRLACLFLLPLRYWPALALGEGIPLLETSLLCVSDLGIPWAISESVPMVVLWMALMKPLRQRWALHDANGRVCMPLMLGAALGVAAITAVATLLTALASILSSPTGEWPDPNTAWPGYLLAYTLGAYLGALTLTPAILALHERYRDLGGEAVSGMRIWRSALFRDLLWWAIPAMAFMTWLALHAHEPGLRQTCRLLLMVPMLGVAWRHGWHGTALGGMAASIALALTAPTLLVDPSTLQAQAILALIISGALLTRARSASAQTARRILKS